MDEPRSVDCTLSSAKREAELKYPIFRIDNKKHTPPSGVFRMRSLKRHAKRHPAVSILVSLCALGAIPTAAWELSPHAERPDGPTRSDARYATQAASAAEVRRRHIESHADESVDSATEACGGLGLALMADKYALPPRAEDVARRFAADYEIAYRADVYRGCLQGLRHGG